MALHQKNKDVLDGLSNSQNWEQIRDQVVPSLIHAFDIGNPVLAREGYFQQAQLLAQEFNQQTLMEREEGVAITSFFVFSGEKGFLNSQIFFAN